MVIDLHLIEEGFFRALLVLKAFYLERGDYCIRAHLSFIQNESHEIIRNLKDYIFFVALISEINNYTKYNIYCSIIFNVVTTLPCSMLIFNSLTISVGHKCTVTFLYPPPLHVTHGFH